VHKYFLVAVILVLGVVLGSVVAQANLITNGGFEEGTNPPTGIQFRTLLGGGHPYSDDISGWTVTNGNVDWINEAWTPAEGLRSLDLNGNDPGTVATTFATTPGATYTVTFYMSGNFSNEETIKTLRVSADGQSQDFSFDRPIVWSRENMGWTQETWTFTANDGSATLTFTSLESGASGPALDNVEVTPIPPSILLLCSGLLCLGAICWRRKPV
jgi:choice-of-anchor C domain-containing protein